MPTVFVAAGFCAGVARGVPGNMNFANYLHIPYLRHAGELVKVSVRRLSAGWGLLGLYPPAPGFAWAMSDRWRWRAARWALSRAAASGVPAGDHGRRLCGGNSVGHPAGGFLLNYADSVFSIWRLSITTMN